LRRDAGPAAPVSGSAAYQGGAAQTADWRRELAAEAGPDELAPGQSRRYGTQDFPPHRPAPRADRPGAAAGVARPPGRAVGAARPVSPVDWAENRGGGEELLVPRRPGDWREPPNTQWPPRGAGAGPSGGSGSYERRPVGTLTRPAPRPVDEPDEELEEEPGGVKAALGYTVVWYSVPVVLFVLYMLVLDPDQRGHALGTLADAAPRFGLSLLLSLPVAAGLRWVSGTWKAASVGLAAAVMGGGLATVLFSAVTGQSLS
jgi:hypothetical protein